MTAPALVIFFGGYGPGAAEQLVDGARLAATFDLLEQALASSAFSRIILATDVPDRFADAPPGVTVDSDSGPFRFGPRLAQVIDRYRVDSLVYIGGGSLPLLTGDELTFLAGRLGRAGSAVIANNSYSSDLIAVSPARMVTEIAERCVNDNSLARLLAEAFSLQVETLPWTLTWQFDIDGPADIAILKLAGRGGPCLATYLASADIDLSRYQRVSSVLVDRTRQLFVAGRAGSRSWQYLERETACRVRFFSEERGMMADGRIAARDARSLLGFYLEDTGIERFFAVLPELCDAAVIDTRVLLAHTGATPSREDRFQSDLGEHSHIDNSFLREFTHAAETATVPVLLGGHSLVSGGLMLLTDYAWESAEKKD